MLEKRKETYERVTEAVQAMISNSDPTTAASLQRQLDEVKEAWEQVSSKAEEEGHKLDDALKNAEELERQLTDMDSWLTQVHDQIVSFDHVSSILDILEKQRQEYKVRNGEQVQIHTSYHGGTSLNIDFFQATIFNTKTSSLLFGYLVADKVVIFHLINLI